MKNGKLGYACKRKIVAVFPLGVLLFLNACDNFLPTPGDEYDARKEMSIAQGNLGGYSEQTADEDTDGDYNAKYDETTGNIDYIDAENLTEEKLAEYIANGGQLHYEWLEDINDGIDIAWAGGSKNAYPSKNTHRMIADQAAIILRNDKGENAYSALSEIVAFSGDRLSGDFTGLQLICEYAWKTDEIENEIFYSGHFFGEDERSFYPYKNEPTALNNFESHYNNAVTEYNNGNKGLAYKELGMSIHYLSDLNAPHHATNKTYFDSWHTAYESWVDNEISKGMYRETTATEETYSYVQNSTFYSMAKNWSALARAQINNIEK